MNEIKRFIPFRRSGLVFQSLILAVLGGLTSFLIWFAFQQTTRGLLFLYLIFAFILLIPMGLTAYRLYALMHASYEIDRDGLRIHWGLRVEEIPLLEIEWVRPLEELGEALPGPFMAMPGAYLGAVRLPNLGEVEFAASGMRGLVIVASERKVIAVSPDDPAGFIKSFQLAAEMGSLTPIGSVSTHPGAFAIQVLKDKWSLITLASLLVATIVLVVLDSLLVLGKQTISLGFAPNGTPLEAVPASNLLLLPVLGLIVFTIDLAGGLFFFPRKNMKLAAYSLWVTGTLAMLLLITASLIIYFSA